MKQRYITGLLFIVFILAGCRGEIPEPEIFSAAIWNVQNLFDGLDNGNEYADFSEAGGWNREKYAARITAISQAIMGMADGPPPDLIGFSEIENLAVLEDLATALSKYGYYWIAFANIPGAPVGIGAISRHPIMDIRAHSITIENESAPRPTLELRIEAQGEPMVFLLCHWKSKTGGEDATTAQRRASARIVQRRFLELIEDEINTPVIVMGDLNENHDEFYRRKIFSALLPDDPDAAALVSQSHGFNRTQDFLVLSGKKPPRPNYFPDDLHVFYSPWLEDISEDYSRRNPGSYFFRDNWETIDHFLLSASLFTGSGWNYSNSRVLDNPPFTNSRATPNRYNPQSGVGLSDHLPLLLYLEFN